MRKISDFIKYITYKFFCLLPIKDNKIILNNFYGKGYGDNPKYIAKELIKTKKYDLVWACKSEYNNTLPKEIRPSNNWYRFLKEFATAKIWISNVRLPRYIKKRKGQFYIQTWHAGLTLKKVEKAVVHVLDKSYVKSAIFDAKQTDLMLSNFEGAKELYSTTFWYDGKTFCDGLPRNDDLVKNKNTVIKNKELEGYKVVLYAPTFRATADKDAYKIDLDKVIEVLNKITNDKWKVIVKLHPNMNSEDGYVKYSENILDYSYVGDINELLFFTDLLITDYSSVMFDYMLLNKPIVLYATDIEEYKKDRDFWIKLEDLPFPMAKSNKELIDIINDINNKDYKQIYDNFGKEQGLCETGNSSKNVVKIIEKVIDGDL